MTLTVLAEADGWIAIDKPPHALVIPGRGDETKTPSIREQLEAQLRAKVWVVHRLDRDTSGVLVFARNARAHRALSMAFEAGQIAKRYLAIVSGALAEEQAIALALVPARRGRMRPVKPNEPGKDAVTKVRPLEALRDATLVEAEPLTGRTHQIRVHLASIGHPLIVDHQYGSSEPIAGADGAVVLDRTPLHAARIEVPKLESVEARVVESPPAEDIRRTLEALRPASK